jgi:hypothetical protein
VEIPYVMSHRSREESGQARNLGGEESNMSDDDRAGDQSSVPLMQQILDNPFILLFIGILVPTMTYIVWGIMELISIPVAQ